MLLRRVFGVDVQNPSHGRFIVVRETYVQYVFFHEFCILETPCEVE